MFSWILCAVGVASLMYVSRLSPPPTWLPLLAFVPLPLIADIFALRLPGGMYLSSDTAFHLICALTYGPTLAAWVAGIEALLSELFIFRRSPNFVARTVGMYILMWLIGGEVYNAVGGEIPLTQPDGMPLVKALLLLLAPLVFNAIVMAIDALLRGTSLSLFFLHVVPRVTLYKTMFGLSGVIGALLHNQLGIASALLFVFIFFSGLAAVRELRLVSEQLARRVATLDLIREIGQMIVSSLEREALLRLIYEGVGRVMENTNFWIALYDRECNEVEYAIIYDDGKPYPPERWPYDPTHFLAAHTMETGHPIFLSTLEEIRRVPIYLGTTGSGRWPESLIAVPILSKGRAIGAISVQSYEPHAYRPEDVETLSMIANQAGIALENARLFREVEASQQYLRAILDSVDYAVIVTDLEGGIRLANRAAENLFGFKEREVIHRSLAEVVRHQSLIHVAERIRCQEVKGRESIQVVLSDERIMATVITPLSDPQVERSGYVVAMADVTPLYRLSELKSQIIRIASHDLRNPLQLASGFFQILLEEMPPSTEMQADLARRVMHHLKAMERLIDELLELERIEVPESRHKEALDIGALIQQVVGEYRWQAEMKGQRLWTAIPPDLPPVWGDQRMLRQAIGNLLDNAVKYTPEGGSITVCTWEEEGEVRITVRDTGVGIPAESLPRIFEHFYRARQPGTEHVSGTGLGLTLVQSIVQEHGGRVWVESEGIGKGSLFGIALPAVK